MYFVECAIEWCKKILFYGFSYWRNLKEKITKIRSMLENGRAQYNELPKFTQTPNPFKLCQNIVLSIVHIYRQHKYFWILQEGFRKNHGISYFSRLRNVFYSIQISYLESAHKTTSNDVCFVSFSNKNIFDKKLGQGSPSGIFH